MQELTDQEKIALLEELVFAAADAHKWEHFWTDEQYEKAYNYKQQYKKGA